MTQALVIDALGEGHGMPSLVAGTRLKQAVEGQTFIKGGDPQSVEGIKYDFHMGSRILKAAYGQSVDIEKLPEIERGAMQVDPGEVVFVLTREQLSLPNNIVAVLSPKRKLAHSGIIVLGGLAVDPLYSGPLWIGLYNFSSTAFPLRPGKKLIAAMFYELDEDEVDEFDTPESIGADDFPDELVSLIKNYRPIELGGLQEEIKETKRQLNLLRSELTDDKTWKDEFKKSLDQHNNQLGKLIEGLTEERDIRKQEDQKIRDKFETLETRVSGFWTTLFTSFRVGWFLLALVIGVVLSWLITKGLDSFLSPPAP